MMSFVVLGIVFVVFMINSCTSFSVLPYKYQDAISISTSTSTATVNPSITINPFTTKPQYTLYATLNTNDENDNNNIPDMDDTGIIILAGGKGSRMKSNIPKQFLLLQNIPILYHSLNLFLNVLPQYLIENNKKPPSIIVLVIDPSYQNDEYTTIVNHYNGRIVFANPGIERQGSVENGVRKLIEVSSTTKYVAIHDSARPLVTIQEVCDVVSDGKLYDAAVLGVPCKATIKECITTTTSSTTDINDSTSTSTSTSSTTMVVRTIPRSTLWEVHTPQVINITKLQIGFEKVLKDNIEVTDDVSIIEALNEPVKITQGLYTNLKITTPDDMNIASSILQQRNYTPIQLLKKQNNN